MRVVIASDADGMSTVSYTHLDVYKRQGLRHVLVPVGACLGRALLGFKVNVKEAVTLVVAIGPGELILQAPQEVAAHVDAHLHGLEQPTQVLLDVVAVSYTHLDCPETFLGKEGIAK